MSRLKVRFDNPNGGWMDLLIWEDDQEKVHRDVSDIFPSFGLLVTALLALWEGETEASVAWTEEPAELDLIFSRRQEFICLEVVPFPGSFRPSSRATLVGEPIFTGSQARKPRPLVGEDELLFAIANFLHSF